MTRTIATLVLAALLAPAALGCHEEGPAERFGKKLDHAVEKLSDEGPMEKAGRKIDEAVEDAKQAAEEAREEAARERSSR